MFKIKPFIAFGLNFLLMYVSWMFFKSPRGDEHLILFMIPLIFLATPFVLTLPQTGILLALNLAFFIFYYTLGILNLLDIVAITFLVAAVAGGTHIVKSLYVAFVLYHKSDILSRQRKYNSVGNDLEAVDRRGRKIEGELGRITRLYEITKRLASALTFDELLDSLFNFLEDNFRFHAVHLLIFKEGNFARGISKMVNSDNFSSEDKEKVLDYEKIIEYAKQRELKPFFAEREKEEELFKSIKVLKDTFMLFPLFVGDKICAILVVEGASRASYGRFGILVSQIALEFRKVELYEKVQELSIIDGLTEVYLRRYLMDRLEEEVERAGRLGLTFSIGMIDVDYFKECNDKYGHMVGDVVLKQIAKRFKKSVREVDMIARYGGEEFCVVLPETPKELAVTVAERLRKSIADKSIKAFDEDVKITISAGIATYPEDAKDVITLIEKSDTELYRAKRKGRNAVCAA